MKYAENYYMTYMINKVARKLYKQQVCKFAEFRYTYARR